MGDEAEAKQRAFDLRKRITAAGLTIAEFRRKSGLTRNVVYALAKGKRPSPHQEAAIEAAFKRGDL